MVDKICIFRENSMALWKGNAFEEGHAGSQMREGLVGSGRRRPEIGREARGRGEGSRPC